MSDAEESMPQDQARTPFQGGGAKSDDPMVTGGVLAAEGEAEPGVRFTSPPTPGAPVGSWDTATPGPNRSLAEEEDQEQQPNE